MNKYINRPVVGIDVAAEFSMVAILAPDGEVYRKSFRINHTLDGFEYLASEIKKVEDIVEIMNYSVMSTPALVVDGVVKSTGKVLSVDELLILFKGI